jgi:hypothetical protein
MLLWTSQPTNVSSVESIAIFPDGSLYGGTSSGVFQINIEDGSIGSLITGYPSAFPVGFTPYPQGMMGFDQTGDTLYMAGYDSSNNSFIVSCYLVNGDFNISMQSPTIIYTQPWYSIRTVAFYGIINFFFLFHIEFKLDGVIGVGVTTDYTSGAISTGAITSGSSTASISTGGITTRGPTTGGLTTGGTGYPKQGNFIYLNHNLDTSILATQIGGSYVTIIPAIPLGYGNVFVQNLIFNQLHNSTTLFYLNYLDMLFYSYNLITNNFVLISTSPFEGFNDNNYVMVQHPNGTIYSKYQSFFFL